ncbi:sulfatase [Pontiella sulfatireligans]|nr:sulfatase [Pontiella sulfatireligans]
MNAWIIAALIGSLFAANADPMPNVLFIAIDDLNACADGMNGETSVHTPNISRLADKGVFFLNAHCAAPACNPSRTSVMTGLAPASSGIYLNEQDWRKSKTLAGHITLPEHFQQNGYKTMGGGKLYHAHTGRTSMYAGFMDPKPWDAYFPSKETQMPIEVRPGQVPMHNVNRFSAGRFDWAELDIDVAEMADAQVVEWAGEQLSQTHEKPLFLAVGIFRPHIPWYTPKTYFDLHPLDQVVLPETRKDDLDDLPAPAKAALNVKWQKWLEETGKWEQAVQAYNASVSFADDMIGQLLTSLENGPMADNTIVVLWSDHGYHLGQKQHWEKFKLWEQTTRVPFIVAAPGLVRAGETCREPVSLLDIYPTLSALCGTMPAKELDGDSLVPLLQNPRLETGRSVVITQGYKNHAVRSDKWRYIRYEQGEEELYDQINDPKNFTNLASNPEYKTVIAELSTWLPKDNAPSPPSKKKSKRRKSNHK